MPTHADPRMNCNDQPACDEREKRAAHNEFNGKSRHDERGLQRGKKLRRNRDKDAQDDNADTDKKKIHHHFRRNHGCAGNRKGEKLLPGFCRMLEIVQQRGLKCHKQREHEDGP